MARRVGDPTTLTRTLNHRYVALWGPQTLNERLANTGEASALADELGEPGSVVSVRPLWCPRRNGSRRSRARRSSARART